MTTLGSVFHDFPRLAKQSGFYFQLHKGRVNWSEIESLNIQEIIEKRNFRLLEQNLINVINCNLEREYDIKILDQNFVKLFKLAQLGIDYLSYCEIYLDRCVVLLQEQLTTFQEEYKSLKQDNQKQKEELIKSKRNKKKNYQCEKCEKIFISDVYLKFHAKRRHSNPNSPNHVNVSQKKLIDNSQQTEDGRPLSISTQTLCFDEITTVAQECEDTNSIQMEQTLKIEKLEQELKNLRELLKKSECPLAEKTESCLSSQINYFHPLNVPGSMCYNSMFMLLPSYIKQPTNVHCNVNPECPVSDVYKHSDTTALPDVNSKGNENKAKPEIKCQLNTEPEGAFSKDDLTEQENEVINCIESFKECQKRATEALVYNKENVDSNLEKNILTSMTKPLPPPRKFKCETRMQSRADDNIMLDTSAVTKEDIHNEVETLGFSSCSMTQKSTPIKEMPHADAVLQVFKGSGENLSQIDKLGSNNTGSLNSRKSLDHESKSIIKKMVARNSPKLGNFSKHLKTSLTNLYGSISSVGKDLKKTESNEQNIRAALVSGVNSTLWKLGVDPEWRGIPKKTMKQKLNILKHRRKLLSKDNPMIPILRQSIEEKIFQKMRSNLGTKQTTFITELREQESINPEVSTIENMFVKNKPDFVKIKTGIMYDTDSDSESKISYSENNFNDTPDHGTSQKDVVFEELTSFAEDDKIERKKSKEFDFSVFQVGEGGGGGGGGLNSLTEDQRKKFARNKKEIESSLNSDTQSNFSEHSDKKDFKALKDYISSKNRDKNTENYNTGSQLQFSDVGKSKLESNNILKSNEGFHVTNTKKTVLFVKHADGIEELSDSPVDDDLWPIDSDSEKDAG